MDHDIRRRVYVCGVLIYETPDENQIMKSYFLLG